MYREFNRDSPRFTDAFADSLRQNQVMTIARGQVAAGLRDADDGFA